MKPQNVNLAGILLKFRKKNFANQRIKNGKGKEITINSAANNFLKNY